MRELVREYKSVFISIIAVCFIFSSLYMILPMLTESVVRNKEATTELSILRRANSNMNYTAEYVEGERIYVLKGSDFNIFNYIVLKSDGDEKIYAYKYNLYVNGKKQEQFSTENCGGYHLHIEILYNNAKIPCDLQVIIEERI